MTNQTVSLIGNGQNVLVAEKNTSSISRQTSEIESWLLLNVYNKSWGPEYLSFALIASIS